MKSIFLLNERLTQGSPSVFFDLLSQNQQYNFHRLYLSKLRAKEIRIPNKKKLADLLTPTRIHVIKDLIDKYNCFLIFSTGLISDFWTGFFIKNPKRVCFIRGHLPEVYSFRFRWMKTGYFLGILHYFIATRFDKVVVMTQSMKTEFYSITGMKADILYNYATPPFSDREDLDKIKKNRISQPIIEIGIVGTLLKAKGIESSILAFSDAINLIPNIRLCIYGSGPEKKYFENICSKYLPSNTYQFFGHVSNKQTIFKNMSVLLHSSYTEGTSRAVLEALSAHVVVLHRAIKGSEELIIPGHNGYLFKDKKTISQDIYRSIELSRNIQRSNRDIEYLLPVNFTKLKFNEKIAELINSI